MRKVLLILFLAFLNTYAHSSESLVIIDLSLAKNGQTTFSINGKQIPTKQFMDQLANKLPDKGSEPDLIVIARQAVSLQAISDTDATAAAIGFKKRRYFMSSSDGKMLSEIQLNYKDIFPREKLEQVIQTNP